MTSVTLVKTKIQSGIWEGDLHVPDDVETVPEVEVTHLDQVVQGYSLTRDPEREGVWLFRFAIPADLLADGVQTFVISLKDGEKLASFAVLTGEPLEDDIRAEVDLLRAELDMLKRTFRRHCVDTGAL